MVTKREKMRNRYLESKQDVFAQQASILRSQCGRKLNARDYQSVINAHHQATSVYDDPDGILRTARYAEALAAAADEGESDSIDSLSTNKATDQVKRSKTVGRPRAKGPRPGQPSATTSATVARPKIHLQPAENPYAKPTYRSFEWLLPSRRRSSVGTEDVSDNTVKRKRRRKLFGSGGAASSIGEVSVSVDEDRTNSSSVDVSVGGLFLDLTGSGGDATQSRELSSNKSLSPRDRNSESDREQKPSAANASPFKDEITASVNGTINDSDDMVTVANDRSHEPCSSTPLRCSPVDEMPNANHATLQSSPHFDVTKLQSRHFSDILVGRQSPVSATRNRTVSQNDEDAYIDVVSDAPVPSSTSDSSVNNQRLLCNGIPDGLSQLSSIKKKKHFTIDGLVNGLRQRTLDGFVRRVPNGSRCPNGIDGTAENVARTEVDSQDSKHSSVTCVRLKQTAVDRVDENSDQNMSSVRQSADSGDNFVDLDSIEGIWRRKTSLRSSTAFMNSLGPDLDELT